MKNVLLMFIVLTTISQAMAFEVKGSATSAAFVGDESCGFLSSPFVEETILRAQEAAHTIAQAKCGDNLSEQNSDFSIKTTCSNFGVWLSMTRLSIEVAADYNCR